MPNAQCSNCKFYTEESAQVRAFGEQLPGICRLHAPVVVGNSDAVKTMFPSCRPDTWCGHWTAKS